MQPLIRHVVMLVGSVVAALLLIGALVLGWHLAVERFARLHEEFYQPSHQHLMRALGAVERLTSDFYREAHGPGDQSVLPFRFAVASDFDDLERHLAAVQRLGHRFDMVESYQLPSRLHRQFEAAEHRLAPQPTVTVDNVTELVALLDPLRASLAQLARVRELQQAELREEQARAADRSAHYIALAVVLLILTTVPLVTRLGLGIRDLVNREQWIRSDLEAAKNNLEELALNDGLTRLGNRHLFKSRLEQVAGAAERSGRPAALMYIDLDNFKRINDSMGHDVGDEVLRVVAGRLQASVRAGDTVARIGGDEFTVIAADLGHAEDAAGIATKLLHCIAEPLSLSGYELVLSASIGITIMPGDGHDSATLMKNADMALYRAKERGRDNFQFFVQDMNAVVVQHMEMESGLRSALKAGQFSLHYQPQFDMRSGRVRSVEALLRWRRENGEFVPPDQFIPVAEVAGLLPAIGDWVLATACADAARLRDQGAEALRVSVNLSPRQFGDRQLIQRIERALASSGLPPGHLEVEITETTLVENIDDAVDVLRALRDLGITVAIDDFGVGYSSLNYLKQLPIDAVKIDRSFVRDIQVDKDDRSIVDAVLAMAHNLSLEVVAEGIETEWQLRYLAGRGCDLGQGYLLARPQPAEALALADLEATLARQLAPQPRGLRAID